MSLNPPPMDAVVGPLAFAGAPLPSSSRRTATSVSGRSIVQRGPGRNDAPASRRRSCRAAVVALAPATGDSSGGVDTFYDADPTVLMPDHLFEEVAPRATEPARGDGASRGWLESATATYTLPSQAAGLSSKQPLPASDTGRSSATPAADAAAAGAAASTPELDALDLEQLPVVGSPTSVSPPAPWDTTTSAHGLSFLARRLDFVRRRRAIVAKAYEECERITALYAKTFYLGTSFLDPAKRKAVWAVYTWCRRTDDLVDGPRVVQRSGSLRDVLAGWRTRLDAIFAAGRGAREGEEVSPPRDALDLALVDVIVRYPDMDVTPFADMIDGMIMDVEMDRFATWDELHLYCYRVAGTVGLMTLPIMGSVDGTRAGLRAAAEPALALGVALQLTNILRDVGEDRLRGRIYLPLEDLERFGYSEADLLAGVLDDRYRALMKFQIARARAYFAKAESGIELLSEDARLPVRASLDMYAGILEVLELNGYDNFKRRAFVSKWGKLATLPGSWARIQPADSLARRTFEAYQAFVSFGSG
uniref:15-cis-phytoene synthase n=1 Tax=Pyropia yezoensis TaxID=2788 RepID=A0AAU6WVU9_PYRYE